MNIRFVDLHYKGVRILQGWRHLKRDMFLMIAGGAFLLVLLVPMRETVKAAFLSKDWEMLGEAALFTGVLGFVFAAGSLLVFPVWNTLHDLQSLCGVIYTYPLYLVRNYIGENALAEGADGGKVKREILYFPCMYYREHKGMVEVTVKLDGSQFHNNGDFENLTKILEEAFTLNMVDMTQRREYLTYHLFRNGEKNRIGIEDVCPDGYRLPLMKGCIWDIREVPHGLVVGGTGGGKSFFLNALIAGFLRMGAELYICDPKNSSLADYGQVLPDVASDPESIMENVQKCVDIMETRYETIKGQEGYLSGQNFSHYGLAPVILVADEFTAFVSVLDKKGREAFKTLIGQIVLKGREAGVFVILATQRPDAADLDGKVRDQLGLRVALGEMSQDGYRMTFGSIDQKLKANGKAGQGYVYLNGMRYVQRFCAPYVKEGYAFIDEAGKIIEKNKKQNNKQEEMKQ